MSRDRSPVPCHSPGPLRAAGEDSQASDTQAERLDPLSVACGSVDGPGTRCRAL